MHFAESLLLIDYKAVIKLSPVMDAPTAYMEPNFQDRNASEDTSSSAFLFEDLNNIARKPHQSKYFHQRVAKTHPPNTQDSTKIFSVLYL